MAFNYRDFEKVCWRSIPEKINNQILKNFGYSPPKYIRDLFFGFCFCSNGEKLSVKLNLKTFAIISSGNFRCRSRC